MQTRLTERKNPFETSFSIDSTLIDFNNKIKEFDENFGLIPWHWFVHGQNKNWGIYIAEYPTVNIIGCTRNLIEKFKNVFLVHKNGYEQLKPFLDKEFKSSKDPDLKRKFIKNYKLITTHHNTV